MTGKGIYDAWVLTDEAPSEMGLCRGEASWRNKDQSAIPDHTKTSFSLVIRKNYLVRVLASPIIASGLLNVNINIASISLYAQT